ncbi:GtrA family protein [Acetobacter sp. TBRC 12305]|uniref:GtrA family protein n=1 Tax=Acetobacter garciniae TaxID=2817435 RepID=A0A939HJS3_9PROT|nr:GtrA family protein [Acetobacter garciniae]MBO1324030.1 GtrA family protein [Acetobacter garciniae]MBX0343719.1 GtrA family protein [Acetobacter garciniae]
MMFLRFLVTGGIAAGVNIGSRYFFNCFVPFGWSVVLAYLVGMLTAYSLARLFVFSPSDRGVASELGRFVLVNLVALVIVWGTTMGLAFVVFPALNFTWHAEDIAHFIGVLSPAVPSFIGHKYFSFKSKVSFAEK